MYKPTAGKEKSFWDALIMIGLCILTGSMIGLALHCWPLPVNKSVFIQNK